MNESNPDEVLRSVPEHILDDIYIAMLDAKERLPEGNANLRRCLRYLEDSHSYEPPPISIPYDFTISEGNEAC